MQILKIARIKTIIFTIVLLAFDGKQASIFCAQKVDVFIAIPLSTPQLKTFQNTITRIQKKIKKASFEQKFEFEIVEPEKLHITLESISNVERSQVKEYERCLQAVVDTLESFDLTYHLRSAKLDLLGKERNWAVLNLLPLDKNDPLNMLFHRLRACFKGSGLKLGSYVDFKPHISVGIFLKNKRTALPVDLSWVPAFDIVMPEASLPVKQIMLTTREKTGEEGKISRKVNLEQCFALQDRQQKVMHIVA